MRIKQSFGERMFDVFNVALLLVTCGVVLLPLMHVVAGSLSETNALIHAKVTIWPVGFNFDNYILVFKNQTFWQSFGITAFVVLVGTALNMLLTIFTGYPLSKSFLRGRKYVMLFIVFTMIFTAPMIPSYLLVKMLGMMNSVWALIIPSALAAFNLILCITFFRGLPEELFEAARVDGMNEYRVVAQIAMPLSMPIIVTLALFYSVAHWNNYYSALLYITDPDLRPLQLYLYNLLAQFDTSDTLTYMSNTVTYDISPQGLQMATIIVATLPIVIIYPFIQKHFIKGAMIGSLKE
ncbi:carbohydrate ABC transporter permease [Paenibacillus sp. J5C_2022]|uniref:carbohydrate ABC transporter permease n=1 Tax=Paenibacillus sp. J5C2022 TaxID=2977129 RepID=UPI0021D23739|nr:carbohydrate ABC transporter permease [Paenibacillus sp. J5C2022]MCU6713113.1 carbohydrate ABC transporter permease [Paenibacillus sp. J5C2022]